MTTVAESKPAFRRAVVLMTVSSFLVPAGGLITSPILARSLGTIGRGELAAALAPAALILPVATLGLPEALTNFIAKHPGITRRALGWAVVLTTCLGVLSLLAALSALRFLSAGDPTISRLIVLATTLTIPALVLGVFRGAAIGRQMWKAVALERVINAALRIGIFTGLWIAGDLTVYLAVLISCLTPVVAGAVYWRLLVPTPTDENYSGDPMTGGTLRPLVSFGSRVWFGAVAEMFLGRIGQLLMTPLSNAENLGLYIVASTISDVPLIVALAIQSALYGVNSRVNDAAQVAKTARLTLLVGFVGCLLIGCALPLWITPLFGPGFSGAVIPTLMLLVSALICIPGLMAAAGLSAWKRPGLRSLGLVLSLVANVSVFVLLVPKLGAVGACFTSIVSNVVMSGFMVTVAGRVMGLQRTDFFVPRRSDVLVLTDEASRLLDRVLKRSIGRHRAG